MNSFVEVTIFLKGCLNLPWIPAGSTYNGALSAELKICTWVRCVFTPRMPTRDQWQRQALALDISTADESEDCTRFVPQCTRQPMRG